MRKFIKRLIIVIAGLATLLIVLAGLLLLPPVQKSLLLRVLNQGEQTATIGELRFSTGSLRVSDLQIDNPDFTLTVSLLQARFQLFRFLRTRELRVETLMLTGTELHLRETVADPAPEDPFPAEPFPGLLQAALPHLHIGTLELRGLIHAPDGTRFDWSVSGNQFHTRPGPNRLLFRLQVEREENGPGLVLQSVLEPSFDREGRPARLTLENQVESLTVDPFRFFALLTAERHANGEDYRLSVFEGSARNDQLPLFSLNGTWDAGTGSISGEAEWSLTSTLLRLPEESLPFDTGGTLQASWRPDGVWSLQMQATGNVRELDRRADLPPDWSEIRFRALADITRDNDVLELRTVDLRVSERTDTPLFRLHLNQPLTLSIPLEDGLPPVTDSALAFLEVPGLPGEWVDIWLPDLSWQSAPITARLSIRVTQDGLQLVSDEPIRVEDLHLSQPDRVLIEAASLRIAPEIRFHPEWGFSAGTNLDLTTAHGEALSLDTRWQADPAFTKGAGELSLQASGWRDLSPYLSSLALGLDSEWSRTNEASMNVVVNADWSADPAGETFPREWWPAKGTLKLEAEQQKSIWLVNAALETATDDGASPEPTLRLRGHHDSGTGQLDAAIDLDLPPWAVAAFTTAAPVSDAGFQTRQQIRRTGTDAPLTVEGRSDLRLTLAESGDWPFQHLTARVDQSLSLGEALEVRSLTATVAPREGDPLLQAQLLRPWSPETPPADQSETALLQLDLTLPASPKVLTPALAEQMAFEGGRLSVQLIPEGEGFLFQPADDGLINGLRILGESPLPTRPFRLEIRPSGSWSPERLSVNLERFRLTADDRTALHGQGRFQLLAGESHPRWTARFEAEGALHELHQLLETPLFTNLERGNLHLTLNGKSGDNDAIDFDGSANVRALRAMDSMASFNLEAPFSGQWQDSLLKLRLKPEITGGRSPQELQIALELQTDASPQPHLRINGSGGLVDVPALEEMARAFAMAPVAREPEPDEAVVDGAGALLPLRVDGRLALDRLVLDTPAELGNLDVRFRGDASHFEIPSLRLRVGERGQMEASGRVDSTDSGVTLKLRSSGEKIDVATLLRQLNPDQVSPLRQGVGRFRAEIDGEAADLAGLIDGLDGNLSLRIEEGRLRPQLSPRFDGLIGGLLQVQGGALGQALGQLAGVPPGINALARAVGILTDLPFDTLAMEMGLSREAILTVDLLKLESPSLFTRGQGTVENFLLSDPTTAHLNLVIHSGARGDLRRQLEILNLLGTETNELGYQMMRDSLPLRGPLAQPDLDPVWNLLYEATRGARVGREELRRRDAERAAETGEATGEPPPEPDPQPPERERSNVEEAVDDLRRLFRF